METLGQNRTWKDQFKANHNLEAISSPELRENFSDFLGIRAGSRDYLLQIPSEKFDESLAGGDSPKKELIHHIGNTILRTRALVTGNLPNWRYEEIDPKDFAKLQTLSKDELIDKLDSTSEELYKVLAYGNIKEQIFLPDGHSSLLNKYFEWMIRHEALHEGFLITIGTLLNLERKKSVKEIWG